MISFGICQAAQEVIDAYLASCARRKPSMDSLDDADHESDGEEDDDQSSKEFKDFKTWLDSAVPGDSSSADGGVAPDAPAVENPKPKPCEKCGHVVCSCISASLCAVVFLYIPRKV